MVRIQIQLPDELYAQLKKLAADKEWSLAETIRRAAELLLRSYPQEPTPPEDWDLPALELGPFVAPPEAWRALAYERDES